MKKNVHPPYQKVLFIDSASGHKFVCGSTLKTEAKEKFEGVEYPVSYLSISSSSHPFFTGSKQLVDSEGRVEKFKKRFGTRKDVMGEGTAIQQDDSQKESDKKEVVLAKEPSSNKPSSNKLAKPAAKPSSSNASKPASSNAAKQQKPAKKKK